MAGIYVTDITHYLDDAGELATPMPRAARQLASFLVLLIDATTAETDFAAAFDTGIRCRSNTCPGTIRTSRELPEGDIYWHCPQCAHRGVITNWQDTKWNQMSQPSDGD